jgi:uncharacterized membrane protein YkvI
MKIKSMTNSLKITSVYVGTVLGAGFASGQEMLKFFAYYGYKGMLGLLLSGVLFGVIGHMTLSIIYTYQCHTYKDLISTVISKKVSNLFEIIVIVFMMTCFCAMFAGCGAMLKQLTNLPYCFGVMLMAVACFVAFIFDVNGIVVINSILAPILLVGTIAVGLYMWLFRSTVTMNTLTQTLVYLSDNWISSTIIYVAYNIITAIVVLCSLGYMVDNKKTAKLSATFSGIILALIGLILGIVVLIYYNDVRELEIPLLAIVMKYSSNIQYIYIVMLFLAMYTTAVANGFGILTRLKENSHYFECRKYFSIIFIIILAISFSSIGFSTIVGTIYPIFGYFGIAETIIITVFLVKEKKK